MFDLIMRYLIEGMAAASVILMTALITAAPIYLSIFAYRARARKVRRSRTSYRA